MPSSSNNSSSSGNKISDKRARHLAFQLVRTEAYTDFLKPYLEIIASTTERPEISNIEDTYRVAKLHARITMARDLTSRIERLAKEFTGQKPTF